MKEPMCPYCNVELIGDDVYDSEIYDNNTFISSIFGECPQCKRDFRWEEVYKYSHCQDLVELTRKELLR